MLWRQANEQPERLGQEFEAGSRQLRSVGSTTEGGRTWDGERLAAGGSGGGGDGSGRAPDVAVMQATDLGNRDDLAEFRPLNSSAVGRILVKREVSTRPVVVREVAS